MAALADSNPTLIGSRSPHPTNEEPETVMPETVMIDEQPTILI
jgi:hypothetical protein